VLAGLNLFGFDLASFEGFGATVFETSIMEFRKVNGFG
jgi:hypothetical protein